MKKLFCMAFACAFLLSAAAPARADFTDPAIISSPDARTYQYNFSPEIVEGADGRLHAFWASNSYYTPEPTFVLYSSSADGGATWSPLVRVDERYDWWRLFEGPKCEIDRNGVFHLAYHYINWWVAISDAKYARSADNGRTWSTVYSNMWGGYNMNGNLALGPSADLSFVWDRWTNNGYFPNETFMKASHDGGLSWSPFWSVRTPAMLVTSRRTEARSVLIDPSGLMHVLLNVPGSSQNAGANTYLVSADGGLTWQERTNIPAGFLMGGIYRYGSELLVPGSSSDRAAFIRSRDNGLTWEGPYLIAGYGHVNQIVSDGGNNLHAFFGNRYFSSRDGGLTWSGPEYMGNGTISKLLLTRDGELLAVGAFGTGIGLIRHKPSADVNAPEYLSLWEKSAFIYRFDVRGTGDVRVSLPAEYVEVGAEPAVTVGGEPAAASVALDGGRIVVTFPVASEDWTACTLAITVKKGVMKTAGALQARIKALEAELPAAAAAGDGARADRIGKDLHALDQELFALQNEFVVSLLVNGSAAASDKTGVSIYEDLTAVSGHFKAGPKQSGASLVLLTDDTISVAKGEPFLLDVKVTHLREGQIADTSIEGNFGTLDVVETSATGARKDDYYLFYPPDTQSASETITVSVTVDGVTTSVPVTVRFL